MIQVIDCAQWGARPVKTAGLMVRPAKGILIHHTAGPNARTLWPAAWERARCFRLARGIQASHIDNNGWRDSGQHFTVTRSGLILEGRLHSFQAAQKGLVLQGAHSGDEEINETFWGIENEGTYTAAEMPLAQWQALTNLCAHLCWWAQIQSSELHGHRDVHATQCPGDALYLRLPILRVAVHGRKTTLMEGHP